ncbi:MAG: hypothetical protein ACTSP4_06940 [Candidatus Hodarchaeales archaeon]
MIAQDPLADIVPIILLIVALVLVMLMLYVSVRLITGKKETDVGYIVRLLIVALIVVIVFPAVAGAIQQIISTPPLDIFVNAGVGSIVAILMFVILIYVTKILLIPETASYNVWERSIWISLLAVFFILLINAVGIVVGVGPLVPFSF